MAARWCAILALFGFGLAASVSTGCAARARRTPKDTLVVIVDDDAVELDPRFTQKSLESKVAKLLCAGLTTVDSASMLPRPLLAASITAEDDRTWLVTIRSDARFGDGTPVTARDVAYTFQSTMDPAVGSRYRSAFTERFAAIEVVDDRTVRFRLREPLATFLTDLDYGIVSASAAAYPGQRFPHGRVVGAGPYIVRGGRIGEIDLERNPHYLDGVAPTPKIIVRTIRDTNTRLLVMVGGSGDFMQNVVRLDIVDRVARGRLKTETGPSAILTYVLVNNADPALGNARVRQAIALAIDREKIVRHKLGGHAIIATGLLPPGHWAYTGEVTKWGYDPARARQLLDEAGYPDPDGPGGAPRLRLTYKTTTDGMRVAIARAIAQQLGEVGIEVEVRSFEFGVLLADLKKRSFQLSGMQTTEIIEPDMYWPYFHSERIPTPAAPDGLNRSSYRSAEADRLIALGRRTIDREARGAIYRDLQRLMAEELPIVPLWHEDNIAILHRDVAGYVTVPHARITGLARAHKP
jgi:peptide/nickel transport system substrate-binding protein